ncbi:MAG TPA: galactose-1-phosphate uridylyltransferase [Gemmatimonadaceae bacterium]|nr:galactose-1-phosphate uridylyltransferase [Gemmatimonadaceae bacterium]
MSDRSTEVWEERWHPLREEWIIVAAHRQGRPWIGASVAAEDERLPAHDPACYLCPGNARVSGGVNPRYTGIYVFDNDHPCVGADAPAQLEPPPPPYAARRADGIARVICYTPRHDLTLARMGVQEIASVVDTWRRETRELGARPEVKQVLIFENKGAVVGVSNPHPHAQLYATNFTWKTFDTELVAQHRYARDEGRSLFADIIAAEEKDGRRVLYADEHVVAFVPYFARYAYEVYVAPRRRVALATELSDRECESLARALKDVTVRYDNLWRQSFPYVMPLHQAPTDGGEYRDYHLFVGFLPPLRRPNTLKYLAGPEIGGGNFLSDTSPEATAAELRALATVHYLDELPSARPTTSKPA